MMEVNIPGLTTVVTGAVTAVAALWAIADVVVEGSSRIVATEASAVVSFVAIIPTTAAASIPTRHVGG